MAPASLTRFEKKARTLSGLVYLRLLSTAQLATGVCSEALTGLSTAQLADQRSVGEQLEAAFVPMAAEYERVIRYPQADFDWWMDNVRCVCDGCKPTVFFSKCQITCHPAITYKLRSRIFFAMGFSRDEMLDYYLAEYNSDKAPRDQQTRDWLLPRKQRERGWVVPADGSSDRFCDETTSCTNPGNLTRCTMLLGSASKVNEA